jgi:hypothetical protein
MTNLYIYLILNREMSKVLLRSRPRNVCPPTSLLLNIVLEILDRPTRKEKEINFTQNGKKANYPCLQTT